MVASTIAPAAFSLWFSVPPLECSLKSEERRREVALHAAAEQ